MANRSTDIVYGYAVQTAKGTAASGAYTTLPRRSGGITASSSSASGDTTQTVGRLNDAALRGNEEYSASFEMDFLPGQVFDDMVSSALAARWVDDTPEDTITLDKTPLYLSIAVFTPYLTDASKRYTLYTDCLVTSLALSFPKPNESTSTIGMTVGLGIANKTSPATAPYSALNAPANSTPVRTCEALSVLLEGAAPSSILDALSFQIGSESESIYDIRQCDPAEVVLGGADVNGSMTWLHDDAADQYHRDAAAGTTYELEIDIESPGAAPDYRIVLPTMANQSVSPDYSGDNVTVVMPYGAREVLPVVYRSN